MYFLPAVTIVITLFTGVYLFSKAERKVVMYLEEKDARKEKLSLAKTRGKASEGALSIAQSIPGEGALSRIDQADEGALSLTEPKAHAKENTPKVVSANAAEPSDKFFSDVLKWMSTSELRAALGSILITMWGLPILFSETYKNYATGEFSLREFFAVHAIGSTLFASIYVLFPGALIASGVYLIVTFFILGPVLFRTGLISLDSFSKLYEEWDHQARLKEIAARTTQNQPTPPATDATPIRLIGRPLQTSDINNPEAGLVHINILLRFIVSGLVVFIAGPAWLVVSVPLALIMLGGVNMLKWVLVVDEDDENPVDKFLQGIKQGMEQIADFMSTLLPMPVIDSSRSSAQEPTKTPDKVMSNYFDTLFAITYSSVRVAFKKIETQVITFTLRRKAVAQLNYALGVIQKQTGLSSEDNEKLRANIIFTVRERKTNIQEIWKKLAEANVPANARILFIQELLPDFIITETTGTEAKLQITKKTPNAQLPEWIQAEVSSEAGGTLATSTQPAIKTITKAEVQQIAKKTVDDLMGGIVSEEDDFAQEALSAAKSGKVSEVKEYLKITEVSPEERSALAQALIESKFGKLFSAQQLEEFVNLVLQLHEELPTAIDDKSLAAMKTNVQKNRQMLDKLNTLGITSEKTEAIARLMLDAGIAGKSNLVVIPSLPLEKIIELPVSEGKPLKTVHIMTNINKKTLNDIVDWYRTPSGIQARTKSLIIDSQKITNYFDNAFGIKLSFDSPYRIYFWKETREVHHRDIPHEFFSELEKRIQESEEQGIISQESALKALYALDEVRKDFFRMKLVGTKEIGEATKQFLGAMQGFQLTFATKENIDDANREESAQLVLPEITEFSLSSGITDDQIKFSVPLQKKQQLKLIEKVINSFGDIKKPQKILIEAKESEGKDFTSLLDNKINNNDACRLRVVVV